MQPGTIKPPKAFRTRTLVMALAQYFRDLVKAKLEEAAKFHHGLSFAEGSHDAWTGANGEGYMGLSLSWADPKTMRPIHVAVAMIPMVSHGSEGAKDLLIREFNEKYGLVLTSIVKHWVSDTATAALATSKKLLLAAEAEPAAAEPADAEPAAAAVATPEGDGETFDMAAGDTDDEGDDSDDSSPSMTPSTRSADESAARSCVMHVSNL